MPDAPPDKPRPPLSPYAETSSPPVIPPPSPPPPIESEIDRSPHSLFLSAPPHPTPPGAATSSRLSSSASSYIAREARGRREDPAAAESDIVRRIRPPLSPLDGGALPPSLPVMTTTTLMTPVRILYSAASPVSPEEG